MEGVKGIIFDIDGVLEYQGRTCLGAVETIRTLRDKGLVLRFLTIVPSKAGPCVQKSCGKPESRPRTSSIPRRRW
jgi:ribonucleotide monophosphatase NagD (HAD superfamily)